MWGGASSGARSFSLAQLVSADRLTPPPPVSGCRPRGIRPTPGPDGGSLGRSPGGSETSTPAAGRARSAVTRGYQELWAEAVPGAGRTQATGAEARPGSAACSGQPRPSPARRGPEAALSATAPLFYTGKASLRAARVASRLPRRQRRLLPAWDSKGGVVLEDDSL